jgi:hypothetical protein
MTKGTKTTITIALILFATSIVFFGLMVFQVERQGEQLGEQIATLEAERAQEDSFFRLKKIAEDTKNDRAKLDSYFLESENDSIDFLNFIEGLAPDYGVVLNTNSLEVVEDADTADRWIEVSFTFSGSRMQVDNFLIILENLPYVLRIDEYSMNKKSGAEWEANVSMRVQILSV